jgi:hypothetical protein
MALKDKETATPFDRIVREPLEKIAVEWPADLPKPKRFPATLKDFLSHIVNAKTPADSMRRLRQFLCERGPRSSFWDLEAPPLGHGFKPIQTLLPRSLFGDEKPLTPAERYAWGISQILAIKDADKRGGYFTQDIWLGMGSAYRYWWKDQKSRKARESAKKRKPAP